MDKQFPPTTIEPIAYIRSDFKEKFGIPRQSGRVETLTAKIIFLPKYRVAEALKGIEGFSHLWLLFDFSKAHTTDFSPTVRPPRLGGNKRVGVFASRSPFRPNSIGLSCVKLLKVEHTKEDGDVLIVAGADLMDMTPIYDVKPYLPYADCKENAVGGYADEQQYHRLNVYFSDEFLNKIPTDKRQALIDCLADDPRPSYQTDERKYSMRFADFDVHFIVKADELTVIGVDELFKTETK